MISYVQRWFHTIRKASAILTNEKKKIVSATNSQKKLASATSRKRKSPPMKTPQINENGFSKKKVEKIPPSGVEDNLLRSN